MKIAIDARAYSWAGVGRYVRNLIAALSRLDTKNQYLILLAKEDLKSFAQAANNFPSRNFQPIAVESSYYSWREQVIFWQQLNNISADLFHFPNFNIPLLFNRPYVVTVHDITRFIFPGQAHTSLLKQVVYEYVFKRAVEKARAVICVSDSTKNDLFSLPLHPPHLATTIYEGVANKFLRPVTDEEKRLVRLKLGTANPYLLSVGVWMNHKNLPRLLSAYAKVAQSFPDLKLVITGQPHSGYVPVGDVAKKLGLRSDQIIYAGNIEDRLLPALYEQALTLVFPSLYEGFGLPALEAAACGTPVITSNVTSLPEITHGSALYINPESTHALTSAINSVLTDSNLRSRLIKSGRQVAHSYQWKKCAEQTLTTYHQSANS